MLRRSFLTGLGAWCGALAASGVLAADDKEGRRYATEVRKAVLMNGLGSGLLWVTRSGTGEELYARYRVGAVGPVEQAGYTQLSWFFRDVKDDGKAVFISPALFDVLSSTQAGMSSVHGSPLRMVVTSGYRTPEHNGKTEGAARRSFHMKGLAWDGKVEGYSPRAVAVAAGIFAGGGIGIYPGFTHIDVAKRRCWPKPSCGKVLNGGVKDAKRG